MYSVKTKRIYEPPMADDGYRMLVDRLWPWGVKKAEACLDEWNKDIAPSLALRKWFDGKIRKLFKDKQVDVNNHRDSYTLIQQFVKQHLDNITLRGGEIYHCPARAKQEHS